VKLWIVFVLVMACGRNVSEPSAGCHVSDVEHTIAVQLPKGGTVTATHAAAPPKE
jgi:hypothetical protein